MTIGVPKNEKISGRRKNVRGKKLVRLSVEEEQMREV